MKGEEKSRKSYMAQGKLNVLACMDFGGKKLYRIRVFGLKVVFEKRPNWYRVGLGFKDGLGY